MIEQTRSFDTMDSEQSPLRLLESIAKTNRVIQGAESQQQMVQGVLKAMLEIFNCDRAWLISPGNPQANIWVIPIEYTNPDCPGCFDQSVPNPISPDTAEIMARCLDSASPVVFGSGIAVQNPHEAIDACRAQSSIATALFPEKEQPWLVVLHRCSSSRCWTYEERFLFNEIGLLLSSDMEKRAIMCKFDENEERFRHTFEFAEIGMGLLAMDGHLLRANHVMCDMLGYSEEELRRKDFLSMCHLDDLTRDRPELQQLQADKTRAMRIEKKLHHRDGRSLWIKVTCSIVRDAERIPLYYFFQIENIDQHKRTEEDLELLNFAIDQVSESVYLVDENAYIKYVNDAVCHELGYSRDDLLNGMRVPDIDPCYPMENWPALWQKLKKQGRDVAETEHKDKSGHVFPIEVSANYFEYRGKSYNLAIVRDISERKEAEDEIALLNFAINRVKESIYLLDEQARFLYVNDAACEGLGYSREELLGGMGVPDIDTGYSAESWPELWERSRRNTFIELETNHIKQNGNVFPVEIRATHFIFNDTEYSLSIAHDISERREAEVRLREQDSQYQQMMENLEEVVWLTDTTKECALYVSPAYESIWGQSCESLYANPSQWLDAIHPDDHEVVKHAAYHHQISGDYNIEYRIIRPDGSLRYIHDHAFPIRNEEGEVYRIVGIAQDVTTRKEQEAHIQFLAYHDALTGLPNRVLVMDRLNYAIAQAHRQQLMLAVMFLDLDRFKTINDTLGHPVGDRLLQQTAERLKNTLRAEDTISRVGGDEFLILLPELGCAEDAGSIAEKLLVLLELPFNIDDHELHIRASIGISVCPRDDIEAESLVKYADTALYLAKEQGRNTFRFFSRALDESVHKRLRFENDLRSAINKNQLQLYFQPLFNSATCQYSGVEALLRWKHPELGMISPGEFIPIAEETGLIISIGEWVLRKACLQARIWSEMGVKNFRVSVNLSRNQLEQPDLLENLEQILQETNCPPNILELEITESGTMYEPEHAIVTLQALSDMGFGLALDDYGTGYSSLAYLKRFPLDRLKIDRSFVDGIPEDCDDMAIVKTTVVLASQLRLQVVAEGVETDEQREFLQALGCEELQGYLFARPMPAEDVAQYCWAELLSLPKKG